MDSLQLASTNSSWYIAAKRTQGLLYGTYAPIVVGLPLLLCHREIHGIKPTKSLLFTKIDQLQNLSDEGPKKHAIKISNILLWIAMHHPEVLHNLWEYGLCDFSVKCLYFSNSYEFLDELVPTDAIITLLNSAVCSFCLQAFCGYITPQVLNNFHRPMHSIRLALGKHTDVGSLIDILKLRRRRHLSYDNYDYDNNIDADEDITVHLRCGEVDLEELASLPDQHPRVYISDVSDLNMTWVVQAITILQPTIDGCPNRFYSAPYIEALYLYHSKLTAAGVEAIAKGLFSAGIRLEHLGISSPYLDEDSEIPGYDNLDHFHNIISNRYDLHELEFRNEDGLECDTSFTDCISNDSRDDTWY